MSPYRFLVEACDHRLAELDQEEGKLRNAEERLAEIENERQLLKDERERLVVIYDSTRPSSDTPGKGKRTQEQEDRLKRAHSHDKRWKDRKSKENEEYQEWLKTTNRADSPESRSEFNEHASEADKNTTFDGSEQDELRTDEAKTKSASESDPPTGEPSEAAKAQAQA